MNLTFNQSYEKNRKSNRFSLQHKKTRANDSGFTCSGDTNILTLVSLVQNRRYWRLNKETLRSIRVLLPSRSHSERKALRISEREAAPKVMRASEKEKAPSLS